MKAENIAPWDQLTYFEDVRETNYVVAPGITRLMERNQRRVAFIVSVHANGPIHLSTHANVAVNQGIYINVGDTVYITNGDFGPLTQTEWFINTAIVGATFTVIEILMKDWPTIRWDPNDRIPAR